MHRCVQPDTLTANLVSFKFTFYSLNFTETNKSTHNLETIRNKSNSCSDYKSIAFKMTTGECTYAAKHKRTSGCRNTIDSNTHTHTRTNVWLLLKQRKIAIYIINTSVSADTQTLRPTLPVMADHTLSVLSSEPLTIRSPLNWRHVITWSSWPFNTFEGEAETDLMTLNPRWHIKYRPAESVCTWLWLCTRGSPVSPFLQLFSIRCCRM